MPKSLKTRIQNKHDIEANWLLASNFVPLAGEIIIYDPDEAHDQSRVKVGDGNTVVGKLPFIEDSLANELRSHIYSNIHETAYEHSQSVHAPVDAEKNQNAFSMIYLTKLDENGELEENSYDGVSATKPLGKVHLVAGDNIDITTIKTEDRQALKLDIIGLGTAAFTDASAYDNAGAAEGALASAKTYTDSAAAAVKNELLNGAGEAYDTLKELGDLIDENQDALEALELVAAGKADKDHEHDGYATEAYVDEKIAEIPIPDVSSQIDSLISCGTADPSATITSKFYFKYATE